MGMKTGAIKAHFAEALPMLNSSAPAARALRVVAGPGDVVVMGTPSGVGYARTPPVWMKAGDTIEIEIERIGVLRNPVV